MISVFGYQLFGTFFIPLAVAVISVFILWRFILPKSTIQITELSKDELQKHEPFDASSAVTSKIKQYKKKAKGLGKKVNCCSNKDGKSGACSKKGGRNIENAKVFLYNQSSNSQELVELLVTQLLSSANLPSETFSFKDFDLAELRKHADGSLCIFLMDACAMNGHYQWLQLDPSDFQNGEKPLADMKYAVFSIEPLPSNGNKLDVAVDQWLHKSGAVRACKASSIDLSDALRTSKFSDWVGELVDRIEKWNAPKTKSCKCGPKKRNSSNFSDEEEKQSCSSGGSCSGSDEEDGTVKNAVNSVLDLEDIAQIL